MARSKYGAVKTTVDGITFASQKEATRYGELKLLEKAGEIRNLRLQPRYVLTVENDGYPENGYGRSVNIGEYVADFAYIVIGSRPVLDRRVVEDVKGFKTPLYRWKRKHVEAQYGITILET